MATVIKCIVSDKKAVDVLRLIKEFCLEPAVVEPLDGLNGSAAPSGKTITQAIYDFVDDSLKRGEKFITVAQLRDISSTHGSAHAYSYPLKKLLRLKRLKHGKLPSTYEVLK